MFITIKDGLQSYERELENYCIYINSSEGTSQVKKDLVAIILVGMEMALGITRGERVEYYKKWRIPEENWPDMTKLSAKLFSIAG